MRWETSEEREWFFSLLIKVCDCGHTIWLESFYLNKNYDSYCKECYSTIK